MKRLLAVLIVVLFTCPVYAGQGSAIIPCFRSYYIDSNDSRSFMFYMSNITSESIDVKITLYDKSGAIIQDGDLNMSTGILRGNNVTNWDDAPDDASVSFSLGSTNSCFVGIYLADSEYGYGRIEWTSTGSSVYGMVAHGFYKEYKNGTVVYQSKFAVPINSGIPF